MDFDDEGLDPEEASPGDEACPSNTEEERPERFVTLPVGPDVGLAEVVAAAQAVDQAQGAWHPGMISSQVAEVIAGAVPGASLARVLEAAAGRDSSERDQAVRIELVAACERMMAHLAGLQATFTQEFLDQRGHGSGAVTAVHDEISARLATTSYAAGTIITRAGALEESPRLRAGLASGEVSARKVDVIVGAVSGLGLKERVVLEDYGVELAPTHTPPQLKKALAAAVIAADPAKAAERHEKEVGQRCVTFEPAAHGMSWLSMYLPAEEGLSAYTCLDAIAARGSGDDERGIDARRADAFTGIFTQIMASGRLPDGAALPTHHGQSPHLRFSITAPVLAGDEHTPALLHGYGPICADTARALAMQSETQCDALLAPAFFKSAPGAQHTVGTEPATSQQAGAAPTNSPGGGSGAAASGSRTAASHAAGGSGRGLAAPPTAGAAPPARGSTAAAPSGSVTRDRSNFPTAAGMSLLSGPCQVAPGVIVSLAAHPGATWSERCDLAERLGPDATMDQLDAIYGPARPWPDHQSRAEDLAIWRALLGEKRYPAGALTEPRNSDSTSPDAGADAMEAAAADAEWDWICRYRASFDPMRGLLPPPRPRELPDGTNAQELIGWLQRRQPITGGIANQVEEVLGLICADAYAPSRRLRARIVERDQTCRFPTCQVPAWRCQLDHIVPFDPHLPAWTQTVETNLHALCAHHHQTKTAGIFRVERDPRSGITTWHSPTGHAYARSPEHADYTAVAHHLRDEYHMTLCEEEERPVASLEPERLHALLAIALPGTPATHEMGTHRATRKDGAADRHSGMLPTWPPGFPDETEPPF